jgi:hypothetical protein
MGGWLHHCIGGNEVHAVFLLLQQCLVNTWETLQQLLVLKGARLIEELQVVLLRRAWKKVFTYAETHSNVAPVRLALHSVRREG